MYTYTNALQPIAKFLWLPLLIVCYLLLNIRAGEAAGVRALRGEVHGAGWREGPRRTRDPESEGAPEAGQGCSAGGTEPGQQPGPLRIRGRSRQLWRTSATADSPALLFPRERPPLEGRFVLVFFRFYGPLFYMRKTSQVPLRHSDWMAEE